MNADLLLVLGLLVACVALFIIGKPRMDVVALLVIVILPLTGIISMSEALAGFSDTNVVLIAALFVIGEGLTRTGIAYRLSDALISMSGSSEIRLLVFLMLAVAGLGSVMSSTGVVAIFVPVALNLAERLGVRPGRLMMPLAYAGLISGMLTLVGTAPNMVVDGALREHGVQGFSFFSFTPFGVAVLIIGVVYMLIARVGWVSAKPKNCRKGGAATFSILFVITGSQGENTGCASGLVLRLSVPDYGNCNNPEIATVLPWSASNGRGGLAPNCSIRRMILNCARAMWG